VDVKFDLSLQEKNTDLVSKNKAVGAEYLDLRQMRKLKLEEST
jgi:hypothetical protein